MKKEKENKIRESIKNSRAVREKIIRKYGKVPTSIWKIDYRKNRLMFDPRGRKEEFIEKSINKNNLNSLNTELNNAFAIRGRSVRGKDHADAHSILPYDLMENVVKFYSEKGDTVLDPTMGDMAAQTVTFHLQRNFIGYDVSKKNYDINEEVKKRLFNETLFDKKDLPFIDLNFCSGTKLKEANESVDFIFFSPPYWDLEYYGEEKEQLGLGRTYEDFLNGLSLIIQECHRVLKLNKYVAININDFRKNKHFYAYHVDVYNLLQKAGFKIHDIIIIDWKSCIGQCFASQVEDRKTVAKQHEYIWIATKEDLKVKEQEEDRRSERKGKKNKEEPIEIEEQQKEEEVTFPEGQILMVIEEFDNLISREKAIQLLKERGGLHENGENT